MITFPNAKINIGLYVVEKRPDGYHNLETVFYPVGLQDALEVNRAGTPAGICQLRVSGTLLDGDAEDNLVVKAYRLLEKDYALPPVDIHLFKHIPAGAGLGGGSADAAFMLKLMNEKCALRLTVAQLEDYAARLGADCAFFIKNKPVFATGIGNVFTPLSLSLCGYYIVLVKPDIFVSTRDAFARIRPKCPDTPLLEAVARPMETWKDCLKNDFEEGVFFKYPEIAAVKDRLYDLGAVYASMSGSGSAVYGIFRSPVENVDEKFGGCFCRQRRLE